MEDSQFKVKISVYEGLLVYIELGDKSPSVNEFRVQVLDSLQQMLEQGRPFTLFVDSSKLGLVPIPLVFIVAKFMRENREKIRKTIRASAIIVGNNFISGLLEWIFSIQPPASPNLITCNMAEAFQFLNRHNEVPAAPPDASVFV